MRRLAEVNEQIDRRPLGRIDLRDVPPLPSPPQIIDLEQVTADH